VHFVSLWPDSESTVAGRGGGFLGWTCRACTRPPGQPVTLSCPTRADHLLRSKLFHEPAFNLLQRAQKLFRSRLSVLLLIDTATKCKLMCRSKLSARIQSSSILRTQNRSMLRHELPQTLFITSKGRNHILHGLVPVHVRMSIPRRKRGAEKGACRRENAPPAVWRRVVHLSGWMPQVALKRAVQAIEGIGARGVAGQWGPLSTAV
jgi:hypothetical protein